MSSNTKANNTFSATNVFSGLHVEEWALSMLHYCRSEGCGIALDPRPVALATGTAEEMAERNKEIKEWDAKDMQARGKIGFKVDPHVWSKVEEAATSTTVSVKTASEILAFLKSEYGVQKCGVTEAFPKPKGQGSKQKKRGGRNYDRSGKRDAHAANGTVHFAQSADRYTPVDQREYFPAPRELPPLPPMQESVRDPRLLPNQSGQRFQGTGASNNFGIHQALDRARETASLHGSIRPLVEDVRTEVQREMLEERLREEPSMEIAETPQGSPTPTERTIQEPIAPEASRRDLQIRLGPKPLSRRLGSQRRSATTANVDFVDTGSSAEPDVNDLELRSVADGLSYGTEFLTGPTFFGLPPSDESSVEDLPPRPVHPEPVSPNASAETLVDPPPRPLPNFHCNICRGRYCRMPEDHVLLSFGLRLSRAEIRRVRKADGIPTGQRPRGLQADRLQDAAGELGVPSEIFGWPRRRQEEWMRELTEIRTVQLATTPPRYSIRVFSTQAR
ncbi:hypothetical protein CONPUDRAFT_72298 [Coniophora puteana RWD-64-598 SS2]|uniref:Uncharacterized protein n=1 Tax=Coniophora puteana (strain RWD-64-598) TaxID=741705 RepID=A0A5M3MTS3_CONPW|nr:uncharacterized protein CONPUDRAFT_72298 [Coniophora puteana RWD-64-598 SS2]EIW81941.1 hypothetical protein CONPUDRAFT_72298 [Coniophora puteana RWD-64-598 SS2]